MNQRQTQIKRFFGHPLHYYVYYFSKWFAANPIFYLYFQGRIYGKEKIPQEGSLIVVSNHASYFDPPLLSNSINRPVAFMAKKELFQVPIFKQLIYFYGAYPVNRAGADRSAIRATINALENVWLPGIFLEGKRTPDGRIHEPKLGAALIAAKAQVPLLPVSLWGTEKILVKDALMPQPAPITVRIGDLIAPPTSAKREDLEIVTNKCAEVINSLHDLGR